MYAFGVLLWEILERAVPFAGDDPSDISRQVQAGERMAIPMSVPKPLATLVADCWAADPSARPSFEKVLEVLKTV